MVNFQNNNNDIYSDKLEIKKENGDPCKDSILNLLIEVHDRKTKTKLFDKRDNLLFYFNRMPNLQSNITSKIF